MSVLHLHQLEILLPVRTLFQERRGAVTNFDPAHRLVGTNPRLVHVAKIFALGDRALAQRAALNRFHQGPPATILHPRPHQVSHTVWMTLPIAATLLNLSPNQPDVLTPIKLR